MDTITIRQIEEAGMNAWPAHQQMLYDGWLLRFADGYTKRANSVNPVYNSRLEVDEKIEYCEAIYRQIGLPPVFRLTPLAQAELDPTLAGRGYQKIHPTRVLTMQLANWESPVSQDVFLRELPLEQWMGVFSEISGSLVGKQPAHAEILRQYHQPVSNSSYRNIWQVGGLWVGRARKRLVRPVRYCHPSRNPPAGSRHPINCWDAGLGQIAWEPGNPICK